jgi:hypothetical protein
MVDSKVANLQLSPRTKDIITLYKYKRIFLMIDEWGFYFLLLGLFYTGFPFWLISSILFYGGVAIYTSYKNLDKIESFIVPADQEIHALRDITYASYELGKQIYDYLYDLKNKSTPLTNLETQDNLTSTTSSVPLKSLDQNDLTTNLTNQE